MVKMGVIEFFERGYSVTLTLPGYEPGDTSRFVWFDVVLFDIGMSGLRSGSGKPPEEYAMAFKAWLDHYHQSMTLYEFFTKMFGIPVDYRM
jgi:hypothetical protein